MNRAITFTPATRAGADTQDLHYCEQSSRHRSVQALFQDCGAQRGAARARFLQKAYGEVVARYVGFGTIEHPLPFLRELTRVLDRLSRALESLVDDFRGLGVYILIQDNTTFYLLTGRDGCVSLDWGDGFVALGEAGAQRVQEMPVDVSTAQKELFTVSTRDHLALYRILGNPAGDERRGEGTVLRVVMGGLASDHAAVLESMAQPRWDDGADATGRLGHDMIAHSVRWISFPATSTVRDPLLDAIRAGSRGSRRVGVRAVVAAAVVVALATGGTWFVRHGGAALIGRGGEAVETTATQEASKRLQTVAEARPQAEVATLSADEADSVEPEPTPDPTARVSMKVEWRRSYNDPVTTTPALDGDRVVFGSRNGKVYSLDVSDGRTEWSYTASDGVGASPVVVGGSVVGADYRGNVFRLDKKTGTPVWKRALGAKVVSTPCASDGEVLVGCTDGVAYGLSLETGRVMWRVKTGGRIRASAASAGGRFYLPSYDGKVYAIAHGSGGRVWVATVGGQLSSTPAADDSRVVLGGDKGVYALDAVTGKRRWRFDTPAPVQSYILMEGGRVYAGCNDGRVYCLDAATGEQVWSSATGEIVLSRPRLEGELLFVTSYDKAVYCLDAATGRRIDRLETAGPIYSSPVVAGERVFFGNNQGEFYCINYRSQRSR